MKTQASLFWRILSGFALCAITILLYLSQKKIGLLNPKVINSSILCLIAYAISALSINTVLSFPGKKSVLHILPAVGIAYSGVFAVFALFFITFSNSFVLVNGILASLFFLLDFKFRRQRSQKMAFIPFGRALNVTEIAQVNWVRLDTPTLPETSIQAVVVDLHSLELTAEWQKFLADCSLNNLPVYHVRQVEESLTGRVKIRYMYENDLGALLPSPAYMAVKRGLDIILVVFFLPFTVPIMLLTALAIRLESSGNVLFIQNRVGQGGKEFKIYKFRSMCLNSEEKGAQLAQINDSRITRVGHFIRKTRLDELPQFFNVLKGDMSLIGPRPEQKFFVEQFEQNIPFYNYRHIVKPGVSGWAQVTQGYAGNEDETQIKLEYDLYYIKHFSFSLDILILCKTIKTILTGFGAR